MQRFDRLGPTVSETEWCCLSRNITPKMMYFHYLKKLFWIKTSKKHIKLKFENKSNGQEYLKPFVSGGFVQGSHRTRRTADEV